MKKLYSRFFAIALSIFLLLGGIIYFSPIQVDEAMNEYANHIVLNPNGYLTLKPDSSFYIDDTQFEVDQYGFRIDYIRPPLETSATIGIVGSWATSGIGLHSYQSLAGRLQFIHDSTYSQTKPRDISKAVFFKDLTISGNNFDQTLKLIENTSKIFGIKKFIWVVSDYDFLEPRFNQLYLNLSRILWPLEKSIPLNLESTIQLSDIYVDSQWQPFKKALTKAGQMTIRSDIDITLVSTLSDRLSFDEKEELHHSMGRAFLHSGFKPCSIESFDGPKGFKLFLRSDSDNQMLAGRILSCMMRDSAF